MAFMPGGGLRMIMQGNGTAAAAETTSATVTPEELLSALAVAMRVRQGIEGDSPTAMLRACIEDIRIAEACAAPHRLRTSG